MGGQPVACFEKPERITAIEQALADAGSYRLMPPTDHGMAPITAVHDAELVELLGRVRADAVASGATDGARPLLPDRLLVGPRAADGYRGAGLARPGPVRAACRA